jgi:hypothetical protein
MNQEIIQEELRKRFLPGSTLEQFIKTRDTKNKAHAEMMEAAKALYKELGEEGQAWLNKLENAKKSGLFIPGEYDASFPAIQDLLNFLSRSGIKNEDPNL